MPNIGPDDQTFAKYTVGTGQIKLSGQVDEQRTLGLIWNYASDSFVFDLVGYTNIAAELPLTKRSVLSVVARLFDPLGLLAPIIVPMKVLFQELCVSKYGWDSPLNDTSSHKFLDWNHELRKVSHIVLPRCYFQNLCGNVIARYLCGFCDASIVAFAACTYLVIVTDQGLHSSLVASKTHVAPIDQESVPRLELLSAVLLARLIVTVEEAFKPILQIDKRLCWSDSTTTLQWIKNEEREWKSFVQKRVDEIRKLAEPQTWSYVRSEDNPADIPTRGCKASELPVQDKWWKGPKWLSHSVSEWPLMEDVDVSELTQESLKELKTTSLRHSVETSVNVVSADKNTSLEKITDCAKFSSLSRLWRVTAYVLCFVSNLKKMTQKMEVKFSPVLTAEEVRKAENLWIVSIQQNLLLDPKYEQWKSQLGFFVDDKGLIRCRGRLSNAELPYSAKYLVLLPRSHPITTLIIQRCHEAVGHNGVKETLVQLRSQYWIIKGRQTVKGHIFKCVICRRYEGHSYPSESVPDLPGFRVKGDFAFSFTGIDFAGPLFVKNRKSDMRKVYICLFTYATSRAIHLELVNDLTADTFLRCFRRFVSRRGIPSLIVTDNAKTFKNAAKRLVALFELQEVVEFMNDKRIKWEFNLPKAPWWGGFFERLVKCTKRCINKISGNARLSFDEMHTVIIEIEAILNSRPLTYIDVEDIDEALTPSHLMHGKRLLTLPDADLTLEEEDDRHVLTRREAYLIRTLCHYWRRWKGEYLLESREDHNLSVKKKNLPSIQEGDIVIIHEEGRVPR